MVASEKGYNIVNGSHQAVAWGMFVKVKLCLYNIYILICDCLLFYNYNWYLHNYNIFWIV